MKKIIYYLFVAGIFTLFLACGGKSDDKDENCDSETSEVSQATDETSDLEEEAEALEADTEENTAGDEEFVAFLIKPAYGWKKADEEYFLTFMEDGRLHVQGDDGEATMWEGKWSISNGSVTLEIPELDKNETLTIKTEDEILYLGETKYEPQN